uniref:Uncharacterized protein n=1 Tax=Mantoniella tinhauana virus 1 TaxID=3111543 RepID=A0AB38ZM84_9VIRU
MLLVFNMYALLCKPIAVVQPTQVVLKTRECRIVRMEPTQKENVYEVEVQDAPPILIEPVSD